MESRLAFVGSQSADVSKWKRMDMGSMLLLARALVLDLHCPIYGGFARDFIVRGDQPNDIDCLCPAQRRDEVFNALRILADANGIAHEVAREKGMAHSMRFKYARSSFEIDLVDPASVGLAADADVSNLVVTSDGKLELRDASAPSTLDETIKNCLAKQFVFFLEKEVVGPNRYAYRLKKYTDNGWNRLPDAAPAPAPPVRPAPLATVPATQAQSPTREPEESGSESEDESESEECVAAAGDIPHDDPAMCVRQANGHTVLLTVAEPPTVEDETIAVLTMRRKGRAGQARQRAEGEEVACHVCHMHNGAGKTIAGCTFIYCSMGSRCVCPGNDGEGARAHPKCAGMRNKRQMHAYEKKYTCEHCKRAMYLE